MKEPLYMKSSREPQLKSNTYQQESSKFSRRCVAGIKQQQQQFDH